MAIFVVSTLVIGVSFLLVVENYLEDQARSFAQALLLDTLSVYQEFGSEAFIEEINERAGRDPFSREIYVLFDEDYVPIAGAWNRLPETMLHPHFPQGPEAARGRISVDFKNPLRGRDRRHRRQAFGEGSDDDAVFLIQQLPGAGSLMIVLIAPELEETREFLRRALAGSVLLVSLLGLLGAILLTKVVERKLERLNALSRDIREGDLTRRIPTDGTKDEFDSLAENLNAMLDRIAELLESSRQVTNDIAHDLRTPLTRMQTRLESLRESHVSGQDVAPVVDQVLEDSASVLRMFDGLLRISGVESGSADSAFEQVCLSEIVEDVAELYEPLASDKDLTYRRTIEPELTVHGDRHLLFQAVANVVDNAVKYTPTKGSVCIDLQPDGDGIRLVVEDSGPGIPEREQERVFDRFYRLEADRGSPGNGLGLSLVKAIVELHQGTVRLGSSTGGLTVCVEIRRLLSAQSR